MCDDAIYTSAVERYRAVELSEQVTPVICDVLGAYAPALLALGKDIVSPYLCMYEMHEQGNTRTVIGTEGSTVSVPMRVCLSDLVLAFFTVYGVHVRYKQCAVVDGDASIYVQVAYLIQERTLCEVLG
jgi:hypothetical protein